MSALEPERFVSEHPEAAWLGLCKAEQAAEGRNYYCKIVLLYSMISMKFHTNVIFMNHTSNDKFKKKLLATHKKMRQGQRLYGTTVIGARGQVVIPAEARKEFGLHPGDQMVILGNKFGKVLTIIESNNLSKFVGMVTKHLEGSGLEKNIQKDFDKISKKIKNSTK